MVIGLFGALLFWSCLGCIELVQDSFDAGAFIGWATLACISMIVGGFGYLCFTELVGYFSIRRVDRLARALLSEDVSHARRLAKQWMHSIDGNSEDFESLDSVQEIRQYIASQLNAIDSKVDKGIAKEAVLIAAFVGISPWPMIDGAIVAWRQFRMMRSVAKSYGVRPSTIGTLRLLRKVLISVVFADASEHVTQWIAARVPSIGGLLPSAGQAVATAVLTVRLGRSCKIACRPLRSTPTKKASAMERVKLYIHRAKARRKKTTVREEFTAI